MNTALVTGGAGFIGSHLCEALLQKGYRVMLIDDLSTGRMANFEHLIKHPSFRFAITSVMDKTVLDRLVSESDLVFHLAAAVGVKLVVDRPVYTIQDNVAGTEAVLKTALRYRVKVLLTSTSEVYGKGNGIPFREDDDVVLGPTSLARWGYAASKMVDEFLGLAYWREHGLPVVVARLFNTVGPRQTGRYGMVVPTFIRQCLRGESITVYGDGQQSRCFCDVADTIAALVALAEHPNAPGRVFNIGSTEEVTIAELARRAKRVTGSSSEISFIPYHEAYAEGFEDMRRRVPDTTRLRDLTGWQPTLGLDAILARVRDYLVATPDSR